MATEDVEIAGCCDVDLLELVVSGGVCLSKTEDPARKVAPKQWQKILVAIYAIGNVILGVLEAILEGLSLNEVTLPIADLPNTTTTLLTATSSSTPRISSTNLYKTTSTTQTWQPDIGVEDGTGLILWKIGYILLVCIILPLEFWLLPQTLAKTACWGSFPPNETRDPYCLCFNINDDDVDHGAKDNCCKDGFCTRKNCCGRLFLKKVAMKLFILFESIIQTIINGGRFLFFTTSRTNLMFAYGKFTYVSGVMLVVIDGLSFLVKSVQFYYTIPCCSNRVCTKYSVFTILSYYVSGAALFSSLFNVTLLEPEMFQSTELSIFFIFSINWPLSPIAFMFVPMFICFACKAFKGISHKCS